MLRPSITFHKIHQIKDQHNHHFQEIQHLSVILQKLSNSEIEKQQPHTPQCSDHFASNNALALSLPKSLKLEFLKFRGKDPTAWV